MASKNVVLKDKDGNQLLPATTVAQVNAGSGQNVLQYIDAQVSAEETARTSADSTLQSSVTANATAISNEASNRASADSQLSAQIAALQGAVGSPLVVSSASDMIDTSKVYVYVGSESGYTSGNWYYYDGSAWTSGGVYNSQGLATDKTLSVSDMAADAKVTGDELTNLKSDLSATQNGYSYLFGYGSFVRGTLYSGSLRTNVLYRVTTTNILKFDYDITLNVTDSFKFGVHLFVNDVFSQDTGWHTSAYTIPANTQFKPVIARRTENTSETADISTFVKQITFQTEVQQKLDVFENYIDKYSCKSVSTISEALFIQGSLNDTGEDYSYAASARAKTDLLFAINDIAIYADTDSYPYARIYVHYFNDNNVWSSASGWKEEIIIPKGSIFRLLLTKVYNSTSAVSVSDIYACFNIFANNKINNTRPCVIVSHQGNVNTTDNYCKTDGYIRAGLAGFDYAECDVKFTSDDIPVCAHSGSFIDATTGNSVRIESYTFTELQNFDYYGGTIASLDEIISICKKYGMGIYIDQYNSEWTDTRYNAIFEVINKYRFAKFCKHIVYDATSAGKILARDKTAWIICGQLYSETTPDSAIDLADSIITDYNKIDVMLASKLGVNVIETVAKSIDVRYGINVYTLDTASDRITFAPFITSITTDSDSYIYI